MSRKLDVYLQDMLVGCLEQTDSGDLAFTYDADYLEAASYGISLSMPLNAEIYKGSQVKAFFWPVAGGKCSGSSGEVSGAF